MKSLPSKDAVGRTQPTQRCLLGIGITHLPSCAPLVLAPWPLWPSPNPASSGLGFWALPLGPDLPSVMWVPLPMLLPAEAGGGEPLSGAAQKSVLRAQPRAGQRGGRVLNGEIGPRTPSPTSLGHRDGS